VVEGEGVREEEGLVEEEGCSWGSNEKGWVEGVEYLCWSWAALSRVVESHAHLLLHGEWDGGEGEEGGC